MNSYRLYLSRLTGSAYYRNPEAVQPRSATRAGLRRRRGAWAKTPGTNNPQFLRKDSKLNFEWRLAIYHIHLRRTA
jgi:hypothetical protein